MGVNGIVAAFGSHQLAPLKAWAYDGEALVAQFGLPSLPAAADQDVRQVVRFLIEAYEEQVEIAARALKRRR